MRKRSTIIAHRPTHAPRRLSSKQALLVVAIVVGALLVLYTVLTLISPR